MSENNRTNNVDLTDEMVEEFNSQLNESELQNPSDYEDAEEKDVEEEKDEEDEKEPDAVHSVSPSFLSTTSGKILVGASVFGVALIASAGYLVLAKNSGQDIAQNQMPETPEVSPIYEELSPAKTPEQKTVEASSSVTEQTSAPVAVNESATNSGLKVVFPESGNEQPLVAEAGLKSGDIKVDFGNLNQQESATASNPSLPENSTNQVQAIIAANQPVENTDLNTVAASQSPVQNNLDILEQAGNPIDPLRTVDQASSEKTTLETQVTTAANPIENISATHLNSVPVSQVAQPDQNAFVENPAPANVVNKEEIQGIVEALINNKFSEKDKQIEELQAEVERLKEEAKIAAENEEKRKAEEAAALAALEAEKKAKGLRDGRTRLSGFSIVNTTMDGTMSIVHAPSGRKVVLYKGEKFFSPEIGNLTVDETVENGNLILVGSKYFIDTEFSEIKKAIQPVVKKEIPVVSKSTTEKPAPAATENKPTVNNLEKKLLNTGHKVEQVSVEPSRSVAKNWVLNGQMGGEFILQTPSGDWSVVKIGDKVEGLGVVSELTNNNDLIIGNFIVEKAKD